MGSAGPRHEVGLRRGHHRAAEETGSVRRERDAFNGAEAVSRRHRQGTGRVH